MSVFLTPIQMAERIKELEHELSIARRKDCEYKCSIDLCTGNLEEYAGCWYCHKHMCEMLEHLNTMEESE